MDAVPQSFDRVLSSMCTQPHPIARRAAERFLANNPGDPETFPSVAELEQHAVDLLGEVVNLQRPSGYIASGGTEANIQAIRVAVAGRDRRGANVVMSESGHFSFRKAAQLLDIELRKVPLSDDLRPDVSTIEEYVDDQTVAIIGVAGSTEYGRVDPIPEIGELAADTGAWFHVDAAYGGFVLPFTDHEWDFSDAVIDSMTIDPHKMGQAAIPSGGFLTSREDVLDRLAVRTPYFESSQQTTLTGTRSGGGVASTVAAIEHLWPDGYRTAAERAADNARWLGGKLEERGFDVIEPELPIVTADIPDQLFDALRSDGWRISRTGNGELRIVCMPHVTREILVEFISDIDEISTD